MIFSEKLNDELWSSSKLLLDFLNQFQASAAFHIAIFCIAKQITVFYMKRNTELIWIQGKKNMYFRRSRVSANFPVRLNLSNFTKYFSILERGRKSNQIRGKLEKNPKC